MTAGVAKRCAALRIPQQRYDGLGKRARIVGARVVDPGFDAEPLGANRRGDDGSRHRQRLENLQARAAAGAQRNDVDGAFGNRRSHIADGPGDGHTADARRRVPQPRRRIAAHHRERRAGNL